MSQDKKEWDILELAAQANKLIEKNFKVLLGLFVVAVVGGLVWAQMKSMEMAKEKEAFAELYKITKIYKEKKADFEEAKEAKDEKTKKADDKQAENKEKKKDLRPATGDLEKDYPEVVKGLEDFLNKNLGRNASGEAALTLSEIYTDYGKEGQGADAISKALGKWKHKNVLYYVMQMRSGDLWASVDQCDKAVSYWQVVANSESFVARQAQLKLGVCLQKIGRMDEAKKWFTQIQEKDPNSSEGFSAKRYLRFLEFKTKTGEATSEEKAQTKDSKKDSPS